MIAGSGQQAAGRKQDPGNRMKAKCVLMIKSGAISQGEFYRQASVAAGRSLVPGFGLSTCSHSELIRILDAVSGKLPAASCQLPAAKRQRPPKDPPNVVRIATVGQLQKAASLERELKIGMDEAAGIARRATGVAHPRTSKDLARYTEALKSISKRRMRVAQQGYAPRGAAWQGAALPSAAKQTNEEV